MWRTKYPHIGTLSFESAGKVVAHFCLNLVDVHLFLHLFLHMSLHLPHDECHEDGILLVEVIQMASFWLSARCFRYLLPLPASVCRSW